MGGCWACSRSCEPRGVIGWLWGSPMTAKRQEQAGTGVLGWHLQATGGNGVAVGTDWVPQVLSLADEVQHEVTAYQILPGVPGVQ